MDKKSKFQNIFDTRSQSRELETLSSEVTPEQKPKKVGRPSGKRSDDRYRQITILLQKKTIQSLKSYRLHSEDKRDLSDIIDIACQEWLKQNNTP